MKAKLSIIDNQVYTKIKDYVIAEVGVAYELTDDNFSMISSNRTDAKFPFIYVHMSASSETGLDIERDVINSGLYSFQIDVFDNESPTRARKVMDSVKNGMKKMCFTISSMPEFNYQDSVYRQTARFRKEISENDWL